MSTLLPVLGAADRAVPRVRRTDRPVVLIGFQEQANLGLGYLAATLRRYGYDVQVFDFEQDPEEILAAVRELKPLLVGFSLIFQFYVFRFRELIQKLRDDGVTCHFTMGGHFPSLSYSETLRLVPEIDSVVRFEGEYTLLELCDRLGAGSDWHTVEGIAYTGDKGEAVTTPMRHLIHDLDDLPYPERDFERKTMVLGRLAMPLVASRGCARTCSFCSIHMFYRAAPGKVVRTRKPAEVVREMRWLHEEHNVTIFLFQDDDFPLFGPAWRRWTYEFIGELHKAGLPGRAIFKLNCRADAVDAELMRDLRDAGLYLVYMGLESGSEEGLDTLHKQITVEQNLRAVETLRSIGLLYEFGFMLFDPSSTFSSIRANLQFLRQICADGQAAAVFCRMIPYDGTPIKDTLAREGRLRGDVCNPDYDFLDPRMGEYYEELSRVVDRSGWIHGHRALSPKLNWIWNEVAVLERLFPRLPGMAAYQKSLREITASSNELLFRVVEDLADQHDGDRRFEWSADVLAEQCDRFAAQLLDRRDRFIARNQEPIMAALTAPPERLVAAS